MGKIFGHFVRGARERAGLSQAEVSQKLGLKSAQFISNIERGIALIPRGLVVGLAQSLRISKDEVLDAIVEDIRQSYIEAIKKVETEGAPSRPSKAGTPLGNKRMKLFEEIA